MPITDILTKNADFYPNDVSLVEINPKLEDNRNMTWREFALTQSTAAETYRKEITWGEFQKKSNRFANLLLSRGIKKGDKVAILLMNCLEWLPIYFGILRAGAVAVPLNFRYTADEIAYCLNKSDSEYIVFGPEFVGRVPITVGLHPLDEAALVNILTEPKNALIKQYKKLIGLDNVELEITDAAIKAVAHRAIELDTGARGLRTILENLMIDAMYDIPSEKDLEKVIVDEDVVVKGAKPKMVKKQIA